MKILKQFPRYGIEESGRVYSFVTKRFLKPWKNHRGYNYYDLFCNEKKRHTVRAARLIYETFKGKIRKGYTVDHLNGIKDDDELVNLDCCTRRQNLKRFWERQA